jgi:23S rRNA (adenine2030-N6)-methyltransferase
VNYRHAFHAGNAADCAKHALLVWVVDALLRKPAPFFVLDTHAGAGRYDLLAGPAERTGEWRDGFALVLHEPPGPLRRYVALASALPGMAYPGSPMLIRAMLRLDDRLACCELHPEDYAALRRLFARDRQVAIHCRDGYEAVRALLPPKQSRGLVVIDPPYEAPGEFERVLSALLEGAARFNHGVYAAWYPIKHRSPVTTFHEAVRHSGLRDIVAAELWWRAPTDPAQLNGCGLLVRNPPYGFEEAAGPILASLLDRLADPGAGAGAQILRLAGE